MAQFLQTGLGYGPLEAGLAVMPWGATTVIVPQIVGRLINRFGERPFIAAGLSLNALALTWIALIAEPDLAYWQVAIPLILSETRPVGERAGNRDRARAEAVGLRGRAAIRRARLVLRQFP